MAEGNTKKTTLKRRKPPAKSKLEQEAEAFKRNKSTRVEEPTLSLSQLRNQMAASALAGLLSNPSHNRAEELIEQAYKYADLMLKDNK